MRAEFLKARYGRVPQIVIVVLALGGCSPRPCSLFCRR